MASRCLSQARPYVIRSSYSTRLGFPPLHHTYATVELCPSPTCACAETPDLEIDRVKPLKNTISPHRCHLVVHTGRADWAKRIEDDKQKPNIAKTLKALLGPKGPFYDVRSSESVHFLPMKLTRFQATSDSVMVTNSSAQPVGTVSIFPGGKIYKLDNYSGAESDFIKTVLVPQSTGSKPSGRWTSNEQNTQVYTEPVILICGHGTRDSRCGVLGPLLRDEFVRQVNEHWASQVLTSRPEVEIISHIGGHVFAGNVIIYFPDALLHHGLSGKVIWYGRVEPKHVEGILKETVEKGNIIEELFRGGLAESGESVHL